MLIAVIGGDRRQRYAAEALSLRGHTVRCWGVPEMPDAASSWTEVITGADAVLLPMPVGCSAFRIRFFDARQLDLRDLAASLPKHVYVFGGRLDDSFLQQFPTARDYSRWDLIARANAVPTAEGAIQIAMEQLPVTISGSRFLVIGAGRCGMALATRLQALGADVTVSARKQADFARICQAGMTPVETGAYPDGLSHYDGIFNTVPAVTVTGEHLLSIREDCLLLELASPPGGFDREACSKAGYTVLSGAALPGRVAPKTAGEIIAREVLTYLDTI